MRFNESSRFSKDFASLTRDIQDKVIQALTEFKLDPHLLSANLDRQKIKNKKIIRKYGAVYRITPHKDYRIIYAQKPDEINLLLIGNRKDIYKKMVRYLAN